MLEFHLAPRGASSELSLEKKPCHGEGVDGLELPYDTTHHAP